MPEVQPIAPHELEPSSPGHARAGSARTKRRRARRRRLVVGGVTTIALVAVAGGAYAFTRGDDTHYRTATVTTGTVDQTVSTTGTVASASRDDAAFSVAGTVGSVKVEVGDTVKAGQVLATLDTSDLDDAVDDAEDTLTTAKQQLADDLDAQSGSTSSGTSAEGASYTAPAGTAGTSTVAYVRTAAQSTPTATATTGSADDVTAAKKKVQAAQDALLAQYDTVKQALAASSDGVTASNTTCATFLAGTTTSGTTASGSGDSSDESTGSDGSAGSTSTPSSTTTPGTGSSSDGLAAALADCQDAVKSVLTDQQTVDDAQRKLLTLATDLDDAVAALQKAVAASGSTSTGSDSGAPSSGATGTGTPSGPGSKGSGSQGSGSKGSGTAGGGAGLPTPSGSGTGSGTTPSSPRSTGSADRSGGGTGTGTGSGSAGAGAGSRSGGSAAGAQGSSAGRTITAEQILADQAEIDLAQSKVTIAKDARARYQLTSRISGTVAQVALAKGDSVSAASSSAVVTVVGKKGYVVEATVPLAKVTLLKTGQTADVSVVGASQKLAGTVTSIGVVDQSETSTPSYTVSITLGGAAKKLYDGSSAQLEIGVAAAKDATVVPTSAVTVSGTKHTVRVLKDGKATTVTVQVGAVGADLTQITSGLTKGETVILADLTKDVTGGSDDAGSSGLGGLGGSQRPGGQGPGVSFSGGFPGGFSGGNRP